MNSPGSRHVISGATTQKNEPPCFGGAPVRDRTKVAMRENTAARRERTARLGHHLAVNREKRLSPRYSPGCQTFCRNAGGLRVAYPCLDEERRRLWRNEIRRRIAMRHLAAMQRIRNPFSMLHYETILKSGGGFRRNPGTIFHYNGILVPRASAPPQYVMRFRAQEANAGDDEGDKLCF